MEKKIYQVPNTEIIEVKAAHLLDVENLVGVKVEKGIDDGEGEAEGNNTSLFDSSDDEYYDDEPTLKWGNLWN